MSTVTEEELAERITEDTLARCKVGSRPGG